MVASSWDNVNTFDDIIDQNEKKVIDDIGSNPSCPFLSFSGRYFAFCQHRVIGTKEELSKLSKPSIDNPIYHAHEDIFSLQLFCKGNYEKCIIYETAVQQKVPK